MRKNLFLVAMPFACILLLSCVQKTTPPSPAVPATSDAKDNEYLDVFEAVWQTVNDEFFDATFGGVDWQEAHDRYRPLIAEARNAETLYLLLNRMLYELNVSHVGAIPPEGISPVFDAFYAEGEIGLDLRLLDGEMVITRVKPGSPADDASLHPGFILLTIDGVPIEQIEAESEPYFAPPHSAQSHKGQLAAFTLLRTYGRPGTIVGITYQDVHGKHRVELTRISREGKTVVSEGLPPIYLDFEARRLAGDVGYIRFNHFHPVLLERVLATVDEMADTHTMILDLRGNPGGDCGAVANKLALQRELWMRVQTRHETSEVYLEPDENNYRGHVVALVDELSGSASEECAGGLQIMGRGVVVGQRTLGGDLAAAGKPLPDGGVLMYPFASTPMADGTLFEGRGVIPDIEVELNRELLLQGIDSQLEAAIDYIERQGTP